MRAKESEENTQHKLLALLSPDDFYLEQHQVVWQISGSLRDAGRPSDAVSITDAAQRLMLHIGGAPYLAGLISDPVARAASHESVMEAAGRIKEFALLRRLQTSLMTGLTLCTGGQDFSHVRSMVEDDLVNLRNSAETSRSGPRQMGTASPLGRADALLDPRRPAGRAFHVKRSADRFTGNGPAS